MNSNAQFATISELDLQPIKMKLMHKQSGEGWTRQQVDAVEVEYRRFLYLIKLFPHEQTAPRFDVDIFWHYHILDTMKYAADCDQIFGYFLHHFPYSGLQGEDDESVRSQAGARMRELYEATFGEAYLRQPEFPTTPSPQASASTAWCNPTTQNVFLSQPASASIAWCNPTTQNASMSQPAATIVAWCNPTIGNLAVSQLTTASIAWCNPTTRNPASSRPASANTAWCNPTTGRPPSSPQALADTAWCNPTTGKPSLSQPPSARTAWCNPTVGITSSQSAAVDTAWCNPTIGNSAWLQGATAITVSPAPQPQNSSFYSQAASAQAA